LVGRAPAFVEIDRLSVFGPEAGRDVAVEIAAEFLPLAARSRADVGAVVAEVCEIVRGRKRDGRTVGRKAQRAFVYLFVVGQTFYLACGGFEQVEVGVNRRFRYRALVAVFRRPAKTQPF